MITILGPTATGKTALAAELAYRIHGEIISADSRQVYREMSIGTGKDMDEYYIHDSNIPYHLVNIVDAGTEYNIFHFQKDFYRAYSDIVTRKKTPVLCGGSGLYIETVLKGFNLQDVPENLSLRNDLAHKSDDELIDMLSALQKLHNKTDTCNRTRLLRAIEIATYLKTVNTEYKPINSKIFGITYEREIVRKRITDRLKQRLENGLIQEAEKLLSVGLTLDKLKYYGLEYKFLALFLEKKLSYDEMFSQLNIAIHQFSKRQMTWFRKMERDGYLIHWVDGALSLNDKIDFIIRKI